MTKIKTHVWIGLYQMNISEEHKKEMPVHILVFIYSAFFSVRCLFDLYIVNFVKFLGAAV